MTVAEEKNEEILLGAGDVYMMPFSGKTLPEDNVIEAEENNVGNCSGGFKIDYKPKLYDVKNQYGQVVKRFITDEQVSAKTGIITWDMKKLAMLSTAKIIEDKQKGTRKLRFGTAGGELPCVLLRFIHKNSGLKFTMIGQGGQGFGLDFGDKETTINAELQGVAKVKDFLAEFEEKMQVSSESVESH
ncbi:TPA: hypothetical protein ACF2DS_002371 [Clostridium perfringens]|uniref:hypothetical protein n=1 Tax=Clostridium perfringens TaxID=1502 RepID=UPI0018AAE15F|nr:hypothetical protein [Clostridium perfringens]EHR1328800.1 hypothetical protein [Clostridium perfringens]EHR1331933.1 hypothetical protein [Clostridium perfringens]EHR1425410.1 hypothetical protein [Clostridium perfringens]EIF6165327.1 hypothetical protein [Clostridium perfringens]MBI5985922.1 hypothetical protein [Clostridium perfringens]